MRKAGDVSFAEVFRDRDGMTCFNSSFQHIVIWALNFNLFVFVDVYNIKGNAPMPSIDCTNIQHF